MLRVPRRVWEPHCRLSPLAQLGAGGTKFRPSPRTALIGERNSDFGPPLCDPPDRPPIEMPRADPPAGNLGYAPGGDISAGGLTEARDRHILRSGDRSDIWPERGTHGLEF